MANLILPDSSVYIDALRAGRDPFQSFAGGIDALDWEFATCGQITLEVCRGLRDPQVLRRFRERFEVMIFLPTTNAVWERSVQLAWGLDRRGCTLPAPDLLIAAHALEADATVLTRDAHFLQIAGLRVINRLD
jgi:predicted nucleic acid-binding protein